MRLSFPAFSMASSFIASSEDSIWRPYAPASLPALRMAACRSGGRLLKVFPEKHSGRMVMACWVMERLGATSKNFICSTPAASFSPAAMTPFWIAL